jgi:hypothetical protein
MFTSTSRNRKKPFLRKVTLHRPLSGRLVRYHTDPYDSEKLRECAAKLAAGVAVIKVGVACNSVPVSPLHGRAWRCSYEQFDLTQRLGQLRRWPSQADMAYRM